MVKSSEGSHSPLTLFETAIIWAKRAANFREGNGIGILTEMNQRLRDATDVLAHARSSLQRIKEEYKKSLAEKTIRQGLKIDIKHVLEDSRSVLDYIAKDLHTRFGDEKATTKVYFPIAARGAKQSDFSALVNRNLPGVPGKRPDVLKGLETFQEFSSAQNCWLPDLATLVNENKHDQLTPQERREARELRIQSGGAGISIGEGASISISGGASIKVGGMVISGNQKLSHGSHVATFGPGKVEHITWVSFEFSAIQTCVEPFLEQVVAGTETVLKFTESVV